jgi:hypothetical protein
MRGGKRRTLDPAWACQHPMLLRTALLLIHPRSSAMVSFSFSMVQASRVTGAPWDAPSLAHRAERPKLPTCVSACGSYAPTHTFISPVYPVVSRHGSHRAFVLHRWESKTTVSTRHTP